MLADKKTHPGTGVRRGGGLGRDGIGEEDLLYAAVLTDASEYDAFHRADVGHVLHRLVLGETGGIVPQRDVGQLQIKDQWMAESRDVVAFLPAEREIFLLSRGSCLWIEEHAQLKSLAVGFSKSCGDLRVPKEELATVHGHGSEGDVCSYERTEIGEDGPDLICGRALHLGMIQRYMGQTGDVRETGYIVMLLCVASGAELANFFVGGGIQNGNKAIPTIKHLHLCHHDYLRTQKNEGFCARCQDSLCRLLLDSRLV